MQTQASSTSSNNCALGRWLCKGTGLQLLAQVTHQFVHPAAQDILRRTVLERRSSQHMEAHCWLRTCRTELLSQCSGGVECVSKDVQVSGSLPRLRCLAVLCFHNCMILHTFCGEHTAVVLRLCVSNLAPCVSGMCASLRDQGCLYHTMLLCNLGLCMIELSCVITSIAHCDLSQALSERWSLQCWPAVEYHWVSLGPISCLIAT